jgi:hypothetical protein
MDCCFMCQSSTDFIVIFYHSLKIPMPKELSLPTILIFKFQTHWEGPSDYLPLDVLFSYDLVLQITPYLQCQFQTPNILTTSHHSSSL